MLCPQCGAENELEQSYCRQCGLALSTVQLALEGHIDEARVKIQNARLTLRNGIGITGMLIFILIVGHMIGAIGGQGLIVTPFDLLCLGMLIVIGLPLTIKGLLAVERANNLLSGKDKPKVPSLREGEPSSTALPVAGAKGALDTTSHFSDSVTEQTTVHLETHKPKGTAETLQNRER